MNPFILRFTPTRTALLQAILVFSLTHFAPAQPQQAAGPQPLNASVSSFGTSYTFGPPTCAGCLQTELGFLSLQDGRYAPAVLTYAPPFLHGDASVLANALSSEASNGHRTTHYGNRLDFALRWKIVDHHGFALTAAPWGTAFIRNIQGGRAGAVGLPQFTWGNNQVVAQYLFTWAVGVSSSNPRTDYIQAYNYTRAIGPRGYAIFTGFQHELTAGANTIGTEIGGVIPFRNGQIELASEQLNLTQDPAWQYQARVIVNWGKLRHRTR